MKITVKLNGIIRKTVKSDTNEITFNFPDESRVADVLRVLGIPPQEVEIVIINGVYCSNDRLLKPNDVVNLFPPIAGG